MCALNHAGLASLMNLLLYWVSFAD